MIVNLKEVKARLSAYVELAAGGEDVLITVRGKPKVRLCGVSEEPDASERKAWGERLEEARGRYQGNRKGDPGSNPALWDALREDRI